MKLGAPFRDVVGRHSFHCEVLCQLYLLAVLHRLTCAIHLHTSSIHDELGFCVRQRLDGFLVEVVTMFMGHKQVVSLRHGRIVNRLVAHFHHRVNLNL